jgi:type I restriction enzyme S subunit
MNRIEHLLQELCPGGVTSKKLGDLADVGTGSSNRNESTGDGKYPFYVRSKTVYLTDEYEFDEEAIVIPGEGGIGDIFHYVNGRYALHQRAYRIRLKSESIETKFALYFMKSNFKKFILTKAVSATVTSIRKPMIMDFQIPVPPLEVQREIVRILDTFTELEAELEAELDARKKQYEHYRESVLSFTGDRSVGRVPLLEIATRNAGTAITAEQMRRLNDDLGEITVFAAGATKAKIRRQDLPAKDVINKPGIVVKSRGYIGFEYCETPFTHKSELWSYCIDEQVALPRFIKHFLETQSSRLQALARSKSVKLPQLSVADTDKLLVPLPSLQVQSHICELLDRFETLTNDLSSGLPAEIQTRRNQYEYYRNQLLTFKELVA